MGSGVGVGTIRRVVLLELNLRPVVFPSIVMSNPVPKQQSRTDAAWSVAPLTRHPDKLLPDFQPHTPIEREIERSERASAALAAARALARASFTDSQLAADDAEAEGDVDTSAWIRTEYAALDHSASARAAQGDAADAAPGTGTSGRNLVGGTFNPGIASLQGRAFPGASIGNTPIRTRTGAQARFLQESRHAPRGDRGVGSAPMGEHPHAAGGAHYDKPAVIPMLATPSAAPAARAALAAPARGRARAASGDPVKFVLAAGFGAALVLLGGGVAWKAGLLSRASPTNSSLITAEVAARAEAARLLSVPPQEIALPAPAAGGTSTRTSEEVDAALAAAARAAAVPVASVHAAGPLRVARPLPVLAAPVVTMPATPVPAAPLRAPAAAVSKDGVAAAIANAQARADNFLSSGSAIGDVPAPAPAVEIKPQP
jgi:hypothetical protein